MLYDQFSQTQSHLRIVVFKTKYGTELHFICTIQSVRPSKGYCEKKKIQAAGSQEMAVMICRLIDDDFNSILDDFLRSRIVYWVDFCLIELSTV